MKSYKIALMPGDGIGPEIIREGVKVLDKTADLNNFNINWVNYDNGAEKYLKTKELITEDTLKEIKNSCKAIYLGALGDPRCKPGILEKGILLKTRFYFDQYINLRPIKLLEGVWCPLKDKTPKDIDFTVVRENTEDFYVGIGNRAKIGKSKQELEVIRSLYEVKFNLDIETQNSEIAYQIGVLSQKGSKRVIEYAFELAKKQGKTKVTAVDKANVLNNIYNFWREIVEQTSKKYPNINHEFNYVDAITMWFVKNPEWFEVVVTPNMFGDIITDLGAMIQGGLGLAPGGNINPKGISMFEPIHGSAPKYKDKNVANPLATIWAGAMMLDEIGQKKAAEQIVNSIQSVIKQGKVKTKDLGGKNTCSDMGDAVSSNLK
ncbi:MAG: isocitrate/isopropylmalate dehydrogenase family protein [Candidatus Woesearchaeota archaeon]|jgi:3-isopropylmalate dehydrogenase|nr:isocitrate/isopropylmalate dehydrogenase family protein [Candidatus Woesearchaeota archaeon]|tara:strand:+ start:9 stop:1136 length:1128 start_codon:yes stop_codon:yes gene_type:complete